MPVVGSFALQIRDLQKRWDPFIEDQAARASALTVEHVKALTPVGHRFDPRTGEHLGESGELRESIKPIKPKRRGEIIEAGASTDVYYAPYVNSGTRPHVIEPRPPRKALHFFDGGREVFARVVHHPGTYGHHFMERGLDMAEREWLKEAEAAEQKLLDVVFKGVGH